MFGYSKAMYYDCIPEKTMQLKYYKSMFMEGSFTTSTVFSEQLIYVLNLLSSKFNVRLLASSCIYTFQRIQMTDQSKTSAQNLYWKCGRISMRKG